MKFNKVLKEKKILAPAGFENPTDVLLTIEVFKEKDKPETQSIFIGRYQYVLGDLAKSPVTRKICTSIIKLVWSDIKLKDKYKDITINNEGSIIVHYEEGINSNKSLVIKTLSSSELTIMTSEIQEIMNSLN